MRLRSINEDDRVTTIIKRIDDNKGNASPNPSSNHYNDSIEDSSDIVSSSSDDDDEGDNDKIVLAGTNSCTDDQDEISDGNSIATANKSNVDKKNSVNWTDEEIKTVTPSKKNQDTDQSQHTPRLGNMFGLMHMLSPTTKNPKNKGNDGDIAVVQKINDDNKSSNKKGDILYFSENVKLI